MLQLTIDQPYDEQSLISRISTDDLHAFTIIYNTYWKRIYQLGVDYLKSPQAAEDMVQDIFLKLWSVRKTLPEVRSFRPYFLVMARNMMISHLRRKIAYAGLEEEGAEQASHEFLQPDNLLTLKEYRQIMEEGIDQLPLQQQRAFRLSRENGMTYEEIASVMDISPLTVRTHMSKALGALREYLLSRSIHVAIVLVLLAEK